MIASGDQNGIIRVWDASTGETIYTLEGHTGAVHGVSFSPDGSMIASGGLDIRIWDASTGKTVRTLEHTGWVTSVSFSPDSMTLASGGSWVRLWDVSTGEILRTFEGHTSTSGSVVFSSDGRTLASAGGDSTILLWDLAPAEPEPSRLAADVNADGIVNIQDLVAVAAALGETGESIADVNGDGVVNIQDLVAVAAALGETAANAPSARDLSAETVRQWLTQARQLNLTDATSQRGIHFLEQLLLTLTPKETALLANYPNPFNPETWIPYQLATPADVTVSIHSVDGSLIRTLLLGHKAIGTYQTRNRAAYWDGKNEVGESVASGVYFYTLTADGFTATRKMIIRK